MQMRILRANGYRLKACLEDRDQETEQTGMADRMTERSLRVLDLYCGRGGFSKGFAAEGFNCVGVDSREVPYPFEFHHRKVQSVTRDSFGPFDVVVGSPPCNEFSTARGAQRPRNPSLELMYEFYRIVGDIKPRYWVMENVNGALPFFGTPHFKFHPWYLWGNFPAFMPWADRLWKNKKVDGKRPIRNPQRVAEIPVALSQPLAQSIRTSLEESHRIELTVEVESLASQARRDWKL